MIVDYHVHLRGRADGREGPIELTLDAVERYVESALAAGVDEIGFTEHMYYFHQFEPLLVHPYQRRRVEHDLDRYCDVVLEAKRRAYPVKLALEVDYVPGREMELADVLAPYPWDYLLGSVHVVDGDAVDLTPGVWERLPVREVWRRYFVALRGLARSGLVDVLAHVDLVKLFARFPSAEEVAVLHEETADAIEAAGVSIEVSTAGLRRPVDELYPAPEFLAACRARSVPATTASDAHVAEDVGRDLGVAVAALRGAGYETVSVFERRAPRPEMLT
ncbi:MAG: histidinol-phosphatase HisJ family protein [Actinomycetota bacterium]|nr:histidinol-phosphatase HisJ family protein [Actinomycetota bacterium]